MKYILGLIFCSVAFAGLTTVTDTNVRNFDNTLYNGRIVVTMNAGRSQPLVNSDGVTLTAGEMTITVVSGSTTFQLQANDAITPAGTSYAVRYYPNVGASWTETWVVPTSTPAVKIASLRSTTVPTPTTKFNLSQLYQGGASTGQPLAWSGAAWAPAAAITANVTGNLTGNVTGTVSTANALTTPRNIYGNPFDGTAALTQVIASTYGGTGNGFTKFSGPASSEKTITIPNANMTITAAAATVLDDTTVSAMVDTLGGASSTGTAGLVRATSPTLVTPVLGVAAATSVTTPDISINRLTGQALPQVAPASVVSHSISGSGYYQYKIAALLSDGTSSGLGAYTDINGQIATLTPTNYLTITTPAVTGATSCQVWRSYNSGTVGMAFGHIGTVACGSAINDTGQATLGTAFPPFDYTAVTYLNSTGLQIPQTIATVPALNITAITPGTSGYAPGVAFMVMGSGTFGPLFRVNNDGGIWLTNYAVTGPSRHPNAMMGIGSDLGAAANGVSLYVETNPTTLSTNDIAWFASGSGATYADGRRLTIKDNGLIAFGTSTSGNPALLPSGTTLEVKLGDNSGYAPIKSSTVSVTGTSMVFQSAGVTGTLAWAPATTGKTITLPNGTTDFTATGGTSQVVKQASSGAAFTVGQLGFADLSISAASLTSAQLATVLSNETGTGLAVFGTSPTITTPVFSGNIVFDATSGNYFCWDATNFRMGIGTCAPQDKISVVGTGAPDAVNISLTNLQNSGSAQFAVTNNLARRGIFGKNGSTYPTYKILAANDSTFYNDTNAGNIAILNDYASGSIVLSAGGGSSAHLAIISSGKVGVGISPVVSGTGLFHATGNTFRSVDALRTPASSSEACNLGESAMDVTYHYFCKATNTWVRTAWSTF